MLRRPFGSTGVQVPVIGQGTWQLRDRRAAAEALAEGLRLGMTHIDTAELYTGSEEVIAPVIQGRREEVFLVSKVLPRNASYEGTLAHCEKSLQRLGTDHLDAYLLHWRTDQYPLEDCMRALRELARQGKTRHVGVSNFDVPDLEEARRLLGPQRLACNQVLYHLGDRGIENELIPYCKRHGIAVVGYSPFGSGDFPPGGRKGARVLEEVGKRHGKTPHQVALNFLSRDEGVFLIPKAERAAHVRENAGSIGWDLTPRDVEELDAAFPRPEPGPLTAL